jgi:hypothetical protein
MPGGRDPPGASRFPGRPAVAAPENPDPALSEPIASFVPELNDAQVGTIV